MKLIEESDLAHFLSEAYLTAGTEPGILMGVRTQNDKMPDGERAFIFAILKKATMEGNMPVRIRNFSGNNTKKEN